MTDVNVAKWTFFFSLCASTMTSFLLFTLDTCHAGIVSSFSHSLSTAAFASGIYRRLRHLEDSIALGLSRVMGPVGSGRAAAPPDAGSPSAPAVTAAPAAPSVVPSPSHEVAASLLRSASLTAASPRTRTRSRSPAPLPKRAPRRSSSVASGLRGSVALAESGLVTGLATKCCPPVPPPQLHLSRVSRALHAASVGSQPSVDASGPSALSAPASEAPCAAETASNSDDDWDALLDAHGLAPSLGDATPPFPRRAVLTFTTHADNQPGVLIQQRALRGCVDHSDVNWFRSQYVCMRPPLAVIFALLWSPDSLDVWMRALIHSQKKTLSTAAFASGIYHSLRHRNKLVHQVVLTC